MTGSASRLDDRGQRSNVQERVTDRVCEDLGRVTPFGEAGLCAAQLAVEAPTYRRKSCAVRVSSGRFRGEKVCGLFLRWA